MIHRKMMKSILIKTILSSFLLLCVSCFKEVDLGFPQKIIFPKGGGEKIVTGKVSFGYAGIEDYRGNSGDIIRGEDGITYTVYDWLSVGYGDFSNEELKVYATPNTTGKRRTLYIEVYSGPEYQVITVKQDK